jgi:hypothetical protein
MMSLRATWLHPDSVKAFNSIDTIFDRRSDESVRDARAAVIAHANTKRHDPDDEEESRAWNARMEDLRVEFYQVLGAAVGYDHSIDYIKTQVYNPQYFVEVEQEQTQIRKQFAKAITNDGLRVVLTDRYERGAQ